MKLPALSLHIVVLLGIVLVASYASASDPAGQRDPIVSVSFPAIDPARYRELVHMVRQDCGSCHGLTLSGGLGPALTVSALMEKPAEGLVATIMQGRPGTAMPPFQGIINEAEAGWIVEQLMQGFPPDASPQPKGPTH